VFCGRTIFRCKTAQFGATARELAQVRLVLKNTVCNGAKICAGLVRPITNQLLYQLSYAGKKKPVGSDPTPARSGGKVAHGIYSNKSLRITISFIALQCEIA